MKLRASKYRYKKLRHEKKKVIEEKNVAFNIQLEDKKFWDTIKKVTGDGNGEPCLCPAEAQREHYRKVASPAQNTWFDSGSLKNARDWVTSFIYNGRGVNENGKGRTFSTGTVNKAYQRTK